jgi:tetratricopeptide (TPR) repeat protein
MTLVGNALHPAREHGARRTPLPVVVALMLALLGIAQAESARQRAAALLKAGNALYDLGQFLEALAKYRQASHLYPGFKIDFNIGITLDAMGRPVEAAEQFESFLRRAPTTGDSPIIVSARQRLEALRQRLASVRLRCSIAGATVTINDAAVGTTPIEERVYVRPGRHRLGVRAEGYQPFTRLVALEAGEHRLVTVTLAAAPEPAQFFHRPPPSSPARVDKPFYKRWWFWTLVGG